MFCNSVLHPTHKVVAQQALMQLDLLCRKFKPFLNELRLLGLGRVFACRFFEHLILVDFGSLWYAQVGGIERKCK